MPNPPHEPPSAPGTGGFSTTRWTMVATARDLNSPAAAAAWEELARRYWQPVFVYLRSRGITLHDAEDLTQDFFARIITHDYLRAAAPEKGRFRTFLRMAAMRFMLNDRDRRHAIKRGGGAVPVSLDAVDESGRPLAEPVDEASAELLYERRWALTILERALARLRAEYDESGRAEEFAALKDQLTARRAEANHAETAARLGTTEGAARVALHRLRKRLRAHFRAEVADTLADESELESELRHVIGLLGQG